MLLALTKQITHICLHFVIINLPLQPSILQLPYHTHLSAPVHISSAVGATANKQQTTIINKQLQNGGTANKTDILHLFIIAGKLANKSRTTMKKNKQQRAENNARKKRKRGEMALQISRCNVLFVYRSNCQRTRRLATNERLKSAKRSEPFFQLVFPLIFPVSAPNHPLEKLSYCGNTEELSD